MATLLLHICCGPCLLYPFKVLKEHGFVFDGLFYNPNIHPSTEYMKRRDTLKDFASGNSFTVFFQEYEPKQYFNGLKEYEKRCSYCYDIRLERTVVTAKKKGYHYFSTTLLYSRRQQHEVIKKICEEKSVKYGIGFFYHDFREGWKWGIEESRRIGMYRQNYCGCIFSEKERFFKDGTI